jgi:hypothetical protein
MTFVYFTDEEGTQIGVPLNRITSIEFTPCDDDHDEDELKVYIEGDEYYEVLGKDARKAWEEIKIQIKTTNKDRNS